MSSLGNALKKSLTTRTHRVKRGGGVYFYSFFNLTISLHFCKFYQKHTVDILDPTGDQQIQLKSIMERNAVDEFLINSKLVGKDVLLCVIIFICD
jgi:hypothetical protein